MASVVPSTLHTQCTHAYAHMSFTYTYTIYTQTHKIHTHACTHTTVLCCVQLFGGLLVALNSLPSWIGWMKYISFIRYATEVIYIVYTHLPIPGT